MNLQDYPPTSIQSPFSPHLRQPLYPREKSGKKTVYKEVHLAKSNLSGAVFLKGG